MTNLYLLSVASLIFSGALAAPLAEAHAGNKFEHASSKVWKTIVTPSPSEVDYSGNNYSFSNSKAYSGYATSYTANSFESQAPVNSSVVPSFIQAAGAGAASTATTASTAASASSIASASSTGVTHTGRATYYEVGNDNCGTSSTDSDLVCAISQELYNSDANSESISTYCGKYININYNGKSVRVKVVDSCPSCGENDLDLSPTAFGDLADLDIGVLTIDWQWE